MFVMGKNHPAQSRRERREEEPFSWARHVARLTPSEFKLRYRLSAESFYELLDIIKADLDTSHSKYVIATKGSLVDPETKLAVALRFFAGGQILDIKLIYKLSMSMCYQCVWLVVDAINNFLPMEFPIDDVEKLKVLEAGFRAKSRSQVWAGQVAAIDGVHFAMEKPPTKDCPNALRYFVARKDEYALLCIAACDAERRFLFYDISMASTTHDSLAFASSAIGRRLLNGELPQPFFINGDNAFVPSNSMMTPSNESALDDYDFQQSSNRMAIECAFGILARRFGILWRPLRVKFANRAPLVGALMRLHNFCIDKRIADETFVHNGMGEIQPGRWDQAPNIDRDGRPVHMLDTCGNTRPRNMQQEARYQRRAQLVEAIRQAGLVRPALSAGLLRKRKRS